MLKNLLLKFIGKKVQGKLEGWGVSKAKLVAVVGVLLYGIERLGPAFGFDLKIGFTEKELLEFLGIWALRDGMDTSTEAVRG